jgi:hypothetical protein
MEGLEMTNNSWEICLICGKRKNAGEACPYCERKSLRMRLKAAEDHIGYQRDFLFAWGDKATSEQRAKHDNMLQCMRNYSEAGKKYKTCDESLIESLKDTLKAVKQRALEIVTEVESDERYIRPTATIFANAPLALIQVGLDARIGTAREVLDILNGSD